MTNAFLKEAMYSATGMAVARTLIRDVAWSMRGTLADQGLIQDVAVFGAVNEAVYWEIQKRSRRLPVLKLYLGSVGRG